MGHKKMSIEIDAHFFVCPEQDSNLHKLAFTSP